MILHIPLAHTGRNEVAPLAGARLTGARPARVGLCLALMLVAFLLFPAETSAHASTLATGGPTLQINVGFNDDSIADSGQQPAPDTLKQSIMVSTATLPGPGDARQRSLSNLETVLTSGATPLIVQAHQGQGTICYLAFDPAVAPISGWAGAIALWKGLLFRTPGDQFLIPDTIPRFSNGPGELNARDGLFQTHAIVTKHTIVTIPIGAPKVNPIDGSDPLLVAGAPATLIGWADQPLDAINAVTVNGVTPEGTHENLVQIPLNIDFSGSVNVPPDLISGQVINAQGNNVQTAVPDVYSVTDGSITFEFVLPDTALFTFQTGISQISSMTISALLMKRPENTGHVQVRLYNWCTSSWNTFTLSQDTFTIGVPKAYTSSDGRVLLQLANQSSSSEVLTFSKPSLSLNRVVSGS